jgi:hypothetical protein
MGDADRTLAEAAFAIGQVELPHAQEALVEALRAHVLAAGQEALAPGVQGARIRGPEVLQVHQREVAAARLRRQHRRDRRNEAPGNTWRLMKSTDCSACS